MCWRPSRRNTARSISWRRIRRFQAVSRRSTSTPSVWYSKYSWVATLPSSKALLRPSQYASWTSVRGNGSRRASGWATHSGSSVMGVAVSPE
jgi:hypothetical protein